MKFTVKNFRTEFPKLGITDGDLVKRFELANKSRPEDYNNSEVVKRMIDMFVLQLNQRYGKTSPQKSEKTAKQPKEKKEKQPKTPKPAKVDTAQQVEKILPEIGFIRRFVSLDGKMLKTQQEKALRILNSLQKAIVEKVIRKTSPYADEIMKIQNNLIKIVDSKDGNTVIEVPENYKEIAKSQKINPEIAIIKAFIAIQGKEGVKDKARALQKRINAFTPSGNHKRNMLEMFTAIDNYVNGRTKTIVIENQTLQGLYGLAGVQITPPKSGELICSTALLGMQFDTLNLWAKWKKLIGEPSKNFRIMVYGKPGGGKSTFSLKFAEHLSRELCLKVLYVAGEEKIGRTLQEKALRLDVRNFNLTITDKVPAKLDRFDVVFFDSVNTLGLSPEQLNKLPKSIACCFVFQTTKDGKFRGSQEYSHDVDTVIRVEDMKAYTEKNRFGGEPKYEMSI